MDSEEAIVQTLLGKFDELPVETIELLASMLPYDTLMKLCSTNRKFQEFCRTQNLLETASLQFIRKEAPLSVPVLSHEDHHKLIKRGFKTTYGIEFNEGQYNPPRIIFGTNSKTIGVFTIIGLPPPKRTKIWVLGEIKYTREEEEYLSEAVPYLNEEDLWDDVQAPKDPNNVAGLFSQAAREDDDAELKEIFDELIENGQVNLQFWGTYYAYEVELP